jgi:tetratricopeptide (TPR) repeat protein
MRKLQQTAKLSVARPVKIKWQQRKLSQYRDINPSRTLTLRVGLLFLTLGAASMSVAAADRGAEVLGHALEGEFSLQAGAVDEAARAYAEAAGQSQQIELIERAATVSLYAKDYVAAAAVGQRWLKVQPESVGARRTLAWAALATGQRQRADELLSELMAMGSLDAQRAVAQVLVAAENREAAPDSLRKLATSGALQPLSNGPSWSAVAGNLGDYATARQLVNAETSANPKSAEAWRRSAQVMLAAKDRKGAQKSLERALELAPGDFDLRLALAGLYADMQRLDLADHVLAQSKPQDDRVFAARLANVAAKPDAKILKKIERGLKKSKVSEVHARAFLLGQLYELRENPDQALIWYAQEPAGQAWQEAQLRRSVLLARDKQDMAAARQLLAQLRAGVDDADQRVDAYLLEAELLTPADRPAAAAVYDEALAANGQDLRLLYARALFRIGDDDVAGLEQDLRHILSLDPDNPQALNALGYTLADRTDRHQEALGYIQRAMAKQPDDGAFVDSMGWVQYRLGNLPEAVRYLRRAYELVQDGDVAAHLAEVLWASDQREEATRLWREALQRWPDSAALRESIARLQPDLLP